MTPTRLAAIAACAALAACQNEPSKEEIEANKLTFACQMAGERVVIRFDSVLHEARVLMPDGGTMALHQIPTASGVRYSNGTFELTGKGSELRMAQNGVSVELTGCANPPLPAKN
jgi:membrane-bound inhibitor of C-type lysozyme